MDHVRELQGRLFSLAIVFLTAACAAYPFFDSIVNFLVAPLGDEHELVYLTPGGAFSFIIKVCMYVGLIGTLPFLIYHLYRFLLPAVKTVNIRRALGYTFVSLVLALIGLSFAYFISLPAALYFLTGFNLHNINPMLTIDSYFSFIMTYMLAGALLFQLPLIISIINTIKPLTPGGMMKYQRQLIVGSFIVAALISPTPDALNQALLAMPVVIMYQLSIGTVWLANRRAKKVVETPVAVVSNQSIERSAIRRNPVERPPRVETVVSMAPDTLPSTSPPLHQPRVKRTSLDGFTRASYTSYDQSRRLAVRHAVSEARPRPVRLNHRTARSLDGFRIQASNY